MKKKQFIDELRKRLSRLKEEEINDIIEEFEQHIDFEIKNGKDEEEIIETFGNINELVKELLEAYDMNESVGDKVESIMKSIYETGEEVFEKVVDFTKETVESVQRTTKEKEFQEKKDKVVDEVKEMAEKSKVVIEKEVSAINFAKGYRIIGLVFLFNIAFSILLGLGGILTPFRIEWLYRFGWWVNTSFYSLAGTALLIIVLIHLAYLIFGNTKDVKVVEVKPLNEETKNDKEVKRVEVKKKRVVRKTKKSNNNVLKIILLIILVPILLPIGIAIVAVLLSLLITSFAAIIPTVLAFGLVIAFAIESGVMLAWFVAVILLGVILIEIAFLELSVGFFKWVFGPNKKKEVVYEEVVDGGDNDEI
jgi:uncharacterized membrane protein